MRLKLIFLFISNLCLTLSKANDEVVGVRARLMHKKVFSLAEEAVQSQMFQDIIANSQSWFKDINDKSWQKDMKIGNTVLTVKLDDVVATNVKIPQARISVGQLANTIKIGIFASMDLQGNFSIDSKTLKFGPKNFSMKGVSVMTRHLIGFDTTGDLFTVKLHECGVKMDVGSRKFENRNTGRLFGMTKPILPYLNDFFCFYGQTLDRIPGVMPDGGDLTWPKHMEILTGIMMDVSAMNGIKIDNDAISMEMSLRTWPTKYPNFVFKERANAAPMLDLNDKESMLQAHISRYPVAGFIETAYNATNKLKIVIPDDLKSFEQILGAEELKTIMGEIDEGLNTNLFGLVADFGGRMGRPMKLQLQAVKVPQFEFTKMRNPDEGDGKFALEGDFKMKFLILEADNVTLFDAITLSYGLNIEGVVRLNDSRIQVTDTKFQQQIALNEETNVDVADQLLIFVLQDYLENLFFKPVEEFLNEGIELPTFGGVLEFQNISLKLYKLFAALKGSIDVDFTNIEL